MHEWYNNKLYAHEDWLNNTFSNWQARAEEMGQLQEWIDELEECLELASADCDIYAN